MLKLDINGYYTIHISINYIILLTFTSNKTIKKCKKFDKGLQSL